jgi:hypothetical protein
MTSSVIGTSVVVVLVSAAAFSTGWVLCDASRPRHSPPQSAYLGGTAVGGVPVVPLALSPHPTEKKATYQPRQRCALAQPAP